MTATEDIKKKMEVKQKSKEKHITTQKAFALLVGLFKYDIGRLNSNAIFTMINDHHSTKKLNIKYIETKLNL